MEKASVGVHTISWTHAVRRNVIHYDASIA